MITNGDCINDEFFLRRIKKYLQVLAKIKSVYQCKEKRCQTIKSQVVRAEYFCLLKKGIANKPSEISVFQMVKEHFEPL